MRWEAAITRSETATNSLHLIKKLEPDLYQNMTKAYSPLINSY